MDDNEPASSDAPGAPTEPVRTPRHWLLWVAVGIIVLLALDQLTKAWAVHALADGPINVLGTTVQFSLARNSGSAFSLFQSFTPLLAVVAIVVTIVLIKMLRSARDGWVVAGLALVLAGALGNLADRIFRGDGFLDGAVIDFVKVGWWPTFNVADAAITVGVVILVWRSFRRHD